MHSEHDNPPFTLVTGGHGFIGSHVARRLHQTGHRVRIVDVNSMSPFKDEIATQTLIGDLCDPSFARRALEGVDTVLHFAAVMGGMGTIHKQNDFPIYIQNHTMTLNLISQGIICGVTKFFYASSACVYPRNLQDTHENVSLRERDAYQPSPPTPQDLYGLEKLHSEHLLFHFRDQLGIRIARFHNVYGTGGSWFGGREKAPAALIRKALIAKRVGTIPVTLELWGDGTQRRSFLWIGDCVDGVIALLNSDSPDPHNIGSEQSVTIRDLGELACRAAGLQSNQVRFQSDEGKPSGVGSRNSCNNLMRQSTGWEARIPLNVGLLETTNWIQGELDKLTFGMSNIDREAMLQSLAKSKLVDINSECLRFAIILPITSSGQHSQDACLESLKIFASSLKTTTWRDVHGMGGKRFQIRLYIVIDHDDTFLLSNGSKSRPEEICNDAGFFHISIILSFLEKGYVCGLWKLAARQAWENGDDYVVLMGDDVVLLDEGWMRNIHAEYESIARSRTSPFGFGCVAFTDISFPGMPTFPVIHRNHLDIFEGEVIPDDFFNQDGDPFLFQLYRRWGCSRMIESRIRNSIGGSDAARYRKRHAENWTFAVLSDASMKSEDWIKTVTPRFETVLTLDIVIPCYRVSLKILGAILALTSSPTCSVMFIIIIDDPDSPAIPALLKEHGQRHDVRIRVNDVNSGASFSRNRGSRESAAEYIHFLDDDVEPDSNLLIEAEKAIRSNPRAIGFVGCSTFPLADSQFTAAVHLAGVTYFWDIAEKVHRHFPRMSKDLPWGVTANLIIKRHLYDGIEFGAIFPKTGGGEDIDYCIRKRDIAVLRGEEGLHAAPHVKVIHPWWNGGARSYWRFYMWAKGDGALVKLHPTHTYLSPYPNAAEMLLLAAVVIAFEGVAWIFKVRNTSHSLGLWLAVAVLTANIVHDLYRHLLRDASRRTDIRTNLTGIDWILAVMESSLIRITTEVGRMAGLLERKEFGQMGWRFDWFVGRVGSCPLKEENQNAGERIAIILLFFSSFTALIYSV